MPNQLHYNSGMHTKISKPEIVFLDNNAIPNNFNIQRPELEHHWHDYDLTKPDQVVERCKTAHTIITSKVKLGRPEIAACAKLKHIAVAATGYNNIDLQACDDLGIAVSNIPSYTNQSVAEHVIACIFSLRRKLPRYRKIAYDGTWQKSSTFCIFDQPIDSINGLSLGIIGYGSLGKATAKIASKLGMQVSVYSPNSSSSSYANVSLQQLLLNCEVISIHCTLNEHTKNLISKEQLKKMKTSAILINTARGGIVDEEALAQALKEKWIAGAAIDVLEQEPPAKLTPLISLADQDNLILTPHIAWANNDSINRLCEILFDNVDAFLKGKPQNIVNP